MATTRLMPLHIGKDRTVGQAIATSSTIPKIHKRHIKLLLGINFLCLGFEARHCSGGCHLGLVPFIGSAFTKITFPL